MNNQENNKNQKSEQFQGFGTQQSYPKEVNNF
jgi:hypothetical protein